MVAFADTSIRVHSSTSKTPYPRQTNAMLSTKYFDDETELVCYGYRYYSPELGRWISRDPIGERGGLSLYGFARNAPINGYDSHGKALVVFGAWRDFPRGFRLGETVAGPATVRSACVRDPACNGCWRLDIHSVDMSVRYWWVWWAAGVRAHELAHVADFAQLAYLPTANYAISKAGCNTKSKCECLRTLMGTAADKFFAKASYTTLLRDAPL